MYNYKIVVQYDGTRYSGWQSQEHTEQTIQGKLQQVLEKMEGAFVEVHGSGRTDAGTHALGQVANFKLKKQREAKELLMYLNRYLPEDIAVLEVEPVEERFHSRLSAVEKTYVYRIWNSAIPNVFQRKYMYTMEEPLNVEAMRRGAEYLLGTHDFQSFCSNKRMKKSTVRTISAITIEQEGAEIRISYTGNGFLYNMVRILTGTLMEIGLGKRKPEELPAVFAGRDRSLAGVTLPAQGLTLLCVFYEK